MLTRVDLASQSAAWWMLGIAACALLLRGFAVGGRPLWSDESFSLLLACRHSLAEIVHVTSTDVHPPLYYLVLKCWCGVTGQTIEAARWMSVCFGVLSVTAAYWLGSVSAKSIGQVSSPQRAGIAAAALLCVSPVHVIWSAQARMYSLAVFLAILSTAALTAGMLPESQKRSRWIVFAIASSILVLTHPFGLLVAGCQLAVALLFLLNHKRSENNSVEFPLRTAIASIGAVGAGIGLWLSRYLQQAERVEQDFWIRPLSGRVLLEEWWHVCIPTFPMETPNLWGTILLAVCTAGCLLIYGQQIRSLAAACPAVSACGPVLVAVNYSLLVSSIIFYRYLQIPLAILLCLLGALAVSLKPAIGWRAAYVVVLLGMLLNSVILTKNLTVKRAGVEAALQHALQSSGPDCIVVVDDLTSFPSARWIAETRLQLSVYVPRRREIKHWQGKPLIRPSDLIDSKALHETPRPVWVLYEVGSEQLEHRGLTDKFFATHPHDLSFHRIVIGLRDET